MGFFGDLFSGLGGSGNLGQAGVSNPYATSNPYQNPQTWWAQQQQQGLGGTMGAGMSKTPEMFRIDQDLYALQRYTETCGDELEMVDIVEGEEVTDEKIALLKIAPVGKIVKGVGMKISDTKYAVVREVI